MQESFAADVQSIVGPAMSELGFELDGIDDDVDEGGRSGRVVFYRRDDCKVQVYWSAREFEINAMIAPANAPNEHGLYDRFAMWHYFGEFEKRPDLPLEELVILRKRDKENFQSTRRWLAWLRDKIVLNFDAALAAINEW